MSAMSNARWLTLSQLVKILLQLVSLFILSRLLAPSEYGLLAMAFVAVNFAQLLRDMGTGSALVQKDKLNDETTSTVFWLNVFLGVGLALILVGASPFIADSFRAPRLIGILCMLAAVFPLTSASAVHQALLERQSSFRTIARIEIVSSVSGLVVAIVLAFMDFGVYSLVWQTIVNALLSTAQLWIASKWRPKKIWSTSEFKSLLHFSGNLTAFSFVNFLIRNSDSMIIGRVLGPVSLGIYAQAYKVMMFPLQSMTFIAGRALFPVMSRQQHDKKEMTKLYFRAVRMIATVTAPMMAGLWLLREPFVAVALGNQWGDVPIVLAWLAPVGFLQSIISTTGTVFMAAGRTDVLLRLGIIGAILQVGSFFIGVHWGILGVTICYLIANIVNAVPAFYCACRQLECSFSTLITAIWQPILFSLIMVGALYPLHEILRQQAFSSLAILLIIAGLGALIFGALSFVFSKDLVADCKKMLGRK